MIELIEQHRAEIVVLCQRYRVKKLELFGSAASGKFDPATSDVDFFYEMGDTLSEDLADRYFDFHRELETLLSRKVDLVASKYVRNPYFLESANEHRYLLYAA